MKLYLLGAALTTLSAPAFAFGEAAPAPAADRGIPDAPSEIIVFGRGVAKIGVAHAASEGTISGSDLLVRPLLRVAELLEAVPGLIAAQHSGSGKANQYFLRGINLDHGTDFTTYIDDVQMNLRTHGHGQGYLDLNGLIPEIVEREDYRKGPYRADGGDFALAGAAYLTTVARFARPWVATEGGSYGYGRLAGGGTVRIADGELTVAAQARAYNGPWQQPEKLRHLSGFAKYAAQTPLGALELSTHAYNATWHPTEQIPERIVGSAVCPTVFCSPDPTATGRTDRIIVNARLSDVSWHANAYAQHYNFSMYSNPTYANADGSSAQIHQYDRRWTFGLRGEKRWALGPKLDLAIGSEERLDEIGRVGVDHSVARLFVDSFGAYSVREGSASLYAEATWRPAPGLRFIGGVRGDGYKIDVRARNAVAAAVGTGKAHDAIVSPKFAAAYEVSPHVEVYGNWGRGFHSNDARGVVSATPVPLLVPGVGYEGGIRFQWPGVTLSGAYWWLNIASELTFSGDANAVEPKGGSKRHGYELVAFWRPAPWLALDANYTATHARFNNGDRIPNAPESTASLGASLILTGWEASMRVRRLGAYALIEDDSIRDKGSTLVNLRAARKFAHLELYGEVLNVLDSRDKDIAYDYESYVPAFDSAGPIDGRLGRVVEPRTFRMGATYRF